MREIRRVGRRLFVACSVLCGLWLASKDASAQDADLRKPAASSYDVVALRVEFKPDTSRFTTGDGTFFGDLFGGLEPKIDPLPHDESYFQAHLSFLEDYVARVSDGKTVVRTHLIPEVVRLPYRMGHYAPTGPDADSDVERAKLARLVADAWSAADERSAFDMSRFTPGRTAFAIFHAGVGRDVELIGTVLDKTPEDLPSIFFGAEVLDRLGVQRPTFNGFSVDHAMILPRTETRLGTDFIADEPFLLELSINGMLAASFFNYLGVPDLFDVESGRSAIGPYGLMDPQGIFAYGGLFPPEPTAWTKYYLGWTDPVDLSGSGPITTELAAASIRGTSESARVLVSDAEYFLVENRYRDPEHDGLTLRVYKEGEIVEQHVENGDETFNSVVVDGFVGGVVVGVDNYDWALPGGLDSEDNVLNGGILIWHVDERRLRSGLAVNAVNLGDERAIDLEEADGAQDIGHPSAGLFGPEADRGTPFDFFYEGNPVFVETAAGRELRLYENRFGPDTHPSSETNAGGPSFVVVEGFSEPAAEMSFTYRQAAVDGLSPLTDPAIDALQEAVTGLAPGSKLFATNEHLIVHDGDSVFAARVGSGALLGVVPSAAVPALIGDRLTVLEPTPAGYRFAVYRLSDVLGAPESAYDLPASVAAMAPISPIVHSNAERAEAFHVLLRGGGGTAHVRLTTEGAGVVANEGGIPFALAAWTDPALGTVPVVFYERSVTIGETSWQLGVTSSSRVGQPAVGRVGSRTVAAYTDLDAGMLLLLRPEPPGAVSPDGCPGCAAAAAEAGSVPGTGSAVDIDVAGLAARLGFTDGEIGALPVLARLDQDFRLDVLVSYGRHLFAFNESGALLEGFPITLPSEVVGQPLVVGGRLIAAAANGYVYAYGGDGRLFEGFPIEVGASLVTSPVVHGDRLIAASSAGFVKGWAAGFGEDAWWPSLYGSNANTSFVGYEPPVVDYFPDRLIAQSETYNWPNPIQEGVTHLRVMTTADATVEVTIIDAAGMLVEKIDMGSVRAHLASETVWQTDAQSGLYFARFTARTASGDKDMTVVKMAVIR